MLWVQRPGRSSGDRPQPDRGGQVLKPLNGFHHSALERAWSAVYYLGPHDQEELGIMNPNNYSDEA
jgi:hypothetical protein